MDRLTLERRQVWIYLFAILGGLLVGSAWTGAGRSFEALLWPTLMVLLYATFVHVPLLHLCEGFRDHRFVAAVLTGNFSAYGWLCLARLGTTSALGIKVSGIRLT